MASSQEESAFRFIPQGAIIQEFRVAGFNIVQSFPHEELYRTHNDPYFGETIGRTTNRVHGAVVSLNGRDCNLSQNDGLNSLHGGKEGWGKQVFDGPHPVNRNGKEGVMFKYLSKDGDQGYPGTVEVRVWYTASKEEEDGVGKTVLEVEYEVEMVGSECEETVVGVTNHSYFNLSGKPTIEGTQAILETDRYLPVDDTGIPKGSIERYAGTKSSKPFILGAEEPDIDDCFVMDEAITSIPLDTRSRPLTRLASLFHPNTDMHLEVYSTEPAFQFYTGKYVDVPAAADSPARPPRCGICIEPSRYVNACNVPAWRSMVLLKRGERWGARNLYKAWKF